MFRFACIYLWYTPKWHAPFHLFKCFRNLETRIPVFTRLTVMLHKISETKLDCTIYLILFLLFNSPARNCLIRRELFSLKYRSKLPCIAAEIRFYYSPVAKFVSYASVTEIWMLKRNFNTVGEYSTTWSYRVSLPLHNAKYRQRI